ncbi:MAG: M42 family metallopeptidase [Candidatus Cloacimonetes bacterium]|nr:M42 family metallopeptidase [Candidatus Cloacimonadota bacterium]
METKYKQYFLDTLKKLVNTPSPSGYTFHLKNFLLNELKQFENYGQIQVYKNNGIEFTFNPQENENKRAVCSHFDTLGLFISHIEGDGTIRLNMIGGYPWTAVEGEYVKIHTMNNKVFTGTILFHKASTHIYGSGYDKEARSQDLMYLRLDEKVSSLEDVNALGIVLGDFVSLAPRFEHTPSGFLKSRHLDNKTGIALILTLMKHAVDNNLLEKIGHFRCIFTSGEEIGKGANFVKNLDELLIVDNAVVGKTQNSLEDKVTICVKDSTGPFDYSFKKHLIDLSTKNEIDYVLDVYKSYGCDSETVLRLGVDVRTALIGPGIDASHSYERTHMDSLIQTFALMKEYLLSESVQEHIVD